MGLTTVPWVVPTWFVVVSACRAGAIDFLQMLGKGAGDV
jgi:hypothetical protein